MNGAPQKRLRRGTWRPASLASRDILVIKTILAFEALFRGTDYLLVVDMPAVIYGGVETALPVQAWAGMCFTIAVLLGVGMALRCHFCVFAGHAVGAVVYLALTVASVQYVFELPEPDAWRRAAPLLLIMFLHCILAVRSGPIPLPGKGCITQKIDVGSSK